MTRVENWESRLYEAVEAWKDNEFVWGQTDCCAFCGSVVEALVGENPWESWREQYYDADSASTAIMGEGFQSLYRLLRDLFGPPIKVAMAKRGDLVFSPKTGTDFAQVGVCLGRLSVSVSEDGGLIYVPTLKLRRAFHVG